MHISSLQTPQDVTLWSELYSATHGGSSYVITFDFTPSESQADREAVAESMLASWTWA